MKNQTWMGIVLLIWAPFATAAHLNGTDVQAAMQTALTAMNIKGELVPGSVQFANAPVLVKNPQLKVERANITGSNRLEARLKCRPAYACLPFHATAQVRLAAALPHGLKRSWSAASQGGVQGGPPMLKPGEGVTFVSERSGARLLVRAVALERGELGELVRVRAVDGKHEVLRGRLCGEHVVRSES